MSHHREQQRIHKHYNREFDLIQQNYLSNKERLFNILDDSGRHHLVQLEQLEKELQDLEQKYNVDHQEQEQHFGRQLQALRNENRVQTEQIKHVQDSKNMLSHTNQVLSQRVTEMAEQLEALLNKLHEIQVERDNDKQAIQSCSEKIENLCELLQISTNIGQAHIATSKSYQNKAKTLMDSVQHQNNVIAELERQLKIKSETITSLEAHIGKDQIYIDQLQRLNKRLERVYEENNERLIPENNILTNR